MSAILRLPNETILTICAHLPQYTLAALVRVNHRLHDVVEHLLYAEITILDVIDAPPQSLVIPSRTLACCAAVRARSYLAAHTRRISIRWSRDRARAHTPARFTPDLFQALYFLLAAAAPSLDVLELHLAGLPPHFDLYPLLAAVTHSRLRRLALSGAPDADTTGLERILHAHPALRDLHLGGDTVRRPLALTPTALSRLTTFRGDARIAACILPGRPVTALTLSSGAEPSEAFLRACACTTRPIRRLDLGALAVTPTQLLAISKHLTQLHALRMRLALRHTLHFTFSGMMLLSALTHVLGAFTTLSELDLSPTTVDGVVSGHGQNETEERALCEAWNRACPDLKRVRFPSGTEWILVIAHAGASSRGRIPVGHGAGSDNGLGAGGSWRRIRAPVVPPPSRERYRMSVR